MPVFRISGFQVTRDPSDTVVAIDPLTLSIFVPDGQTTFSYSIVATEDGDLPEVDISANDVSAIVSGPGVPGGIATLPDDAVPYLGTITTITGAHTLLVFEVEQDDGSFLDAFFQIGGTSLAVPGSPGEFVAIEDGISAIGAATGALAPGATIPFGTLANTTEEAGPNQVVGADGDDTLQGTAGDDLIVTGNATPNGDFVVGSAGNDTIDMSGNDGFNGFVTLSYAALGSGISVTIDGDADTGSVNKGALGTDTLLDVGQPLDAGFNNGGLGIIGTASADSFTLAPAAGQWMSVRGGAGTDSYEIGGEGLVRLDFLGATGGAQVNLATRAIGNDGFGNAETIGGSSDVWEVRGTDNDDLIIGSAADESFISQGGNDTIDGGGGFDRLRYDRGGVSSINADLAAGTVTGTWNGNAFTDTVSNIEWLRGSNGNDVIVGDGKDNRLEGGLGNDTIAGGQGNDFVRLGGGADTYIYSGGIDVLADFEVGVDSIVIDIPGVTQEQVDAAFANPQVFEGATFVDFGVPNQNLNFGTLSVAEVQSIIATTAPSGPVTSLFLKIDPTQAEEVFSIEALGLNPGDLFSVELVGDFKRGENFADETQTGQTLYNGNSLFIGNDFTAIREFSGNTTLRFLNDDRPLDDNSDPDGDFGLRIEKVLPVLTGTDGDDFLFGAGSDDLIVTGNATPNGDFVVGSTGNDTIDMSGNDGTDGFVWLSYSGLDSGIAVTIDGAANTGTVDKGANGTDTLVDVAQPLDAGFNNGGLGIIGTAGDDVFNLAPGANQWMQVRGGAGADTFNIGGEGLVRLDFLGAPGGVQVNLATGVIAEDGFGNTDAITGESNVSEVRGTDNDDLIIGSAADESFISQGGNDTIDGGDGLDRLRYDRGGVSSINADLAAGTVTGTWNGNAFTDTVSNIEWLRGSNGNDVIGGDTNNNRLEGRGGTDTFIHVGGNDTISDFDPGTETLIVRVSGLDQAQVAAAIAGASDTPGGALVTFGSGSVLFSGLSAGALAGADVQVQADGSANLIQGTNGDDFLQGTAGDDRIITGDATPNGDFVLGSTGDDTIDASGMNQSTAFLALGYGALSGPISVAIDGAANTGSVDKGADGTDTLIGMANPLTAGNNAGGLSVIGTWGDDVFDLAPGAGQWMSVQGGNGADSYTINGAGLVRLDFRDSYNGIDIDLGARTIADDGFGNQETIGGNSAVWEVYGSFGDDKFVGSDADESYRFSGGYNNLDGGAGFDRLRYDVGSVGAVHIDAAVGLVKGMEADFYHGTTPGFYGFPFTDVIAGFEWLRGSNGDDVIGGDTNNNRLDGAGGTDIFVHVGGNDTISDFDPSTESLFVRVPGLSEAAVTAAISGAVAQGSDTLVTFSASSSVLFRDLAPGDLAGADLRYLDPASVNLVVGLGDSGHVFGTAGDDLIITGNALWLGEFVVASTGNDTIDMSGNDGVNGFVTLGYGGLTGPVLSGPISVTIDGAANTGSVSKGADGTDTLIGVAQPLSAGWTNGGLEILGTLGNDTFNLAPDGQQWMSVQGGAGTDSYTINGTGLVRMDFSDAVQGIEVNLATRQIANDGFGNAEFIGGTGSVWEVRGGAYDDIFIGSNADESYRYTGGNNTLDGGAGIDRLRYDLGSIRSVDIDAGKGTVTGELWAGGSFTDTISGFEWLRGSNGDDTITGEAGVDNRFEGGFGRDTFVHDGGNDTISDFEASWERVFVRMEVVDQGAVDEALDEAVDTPDGALVTFGSGTVLFSGLSAEDIRFADVRALQADVPPPPPPTTPIAWAVGDPHLLTLDGVGYDFHAIGEYVLLRGTGSFSGFEIQSRMGPVLDSNGAPVPNVSANVAIAARAANGTAVMIDATDALPLSIGGVAWALDDGAFIDVGDDRVFRQGDTYTLVFAGADGTVGEGDARMSVVVRDGFVDVGVQISADMAGQVEGLLGDGDGNPDNDIALADGTVLERPLAFEDLYGDASGTVPNLRDDWRVTTEGQSLFTYDPGETLAGFYDPTAPAGDPTAGATAEDVAAARAAVEGAGLTPGTLAFENAVQDFLLTGDARFIESSSSETAPTPANTGSAGTLAAGDTRVTINVSLTDEGGDGIDGAVVNFSTGGAPILGQAAGVAGSYNVRLGSSTGEGRVDAVRDFETGDGTIDVTDALDALRLAVGLDPSFGPATAMTFIAADVDQSGAVGVTDALDILRFAVGLETPNAPRWVFLGDTQDLSGIARDAVNYDTGIATGAIADGVSLQLTGVLLGDVSAQPEV